MPSEPAQAAPAAVPAAGSDPADARPQARAAVRSVLDGVPQSLLCVAGDGQVWANATAYRQLGEQAAALLQAWLSQTKVAAALLQSTPCTSDLQLPAGMPVQRVHASSQPDGEGGWTISLQAIDAHPEDPSRVLGAAAAITGRFEPDLRSTSERAALAARAAGLGTWEMDMQDGSAHWDDQMWLLRGRQPEPRVMSADERLACVHPDDREAMRDLQAQSFGHQASDENEVRVVWPDGQLRWLATRSSWHRLRAPTMR